MRKSSSVTRRPTSSAPSERFRGRHGKVGSWASRAGTVLTSVTSDGDDQLQLDQIRDYIAQGVDAIVAVPDDSAGICVAVQNAKDAGIPFYTIDRAPSGCAINMTVLSDNYLAGQQSGEAIVAYLTEKYGEPMGTVLEITGNMAQNVAQLRGGGFQDVMKPTRASTSSPRSATGKPRKAWISSVTSSPPKTSTPSTSTPTACTRRVPSRC